MLCCYFLKIRFLSCLLFCTTLRRWGWGRQQLCRSAGSRLWDFALASICLPWGATWEGFKHIVLYFTGILLAPSNFAMPKVLVIPISSGITVPGWTIVFYIFEPAQPLRASRKGLLLHDRLTMTRERAFSRVMPQLGNPLPKEACLAPSLHCFSRWMKMKLYKQAFDITPCFLFSYWCDVLIYFLLPH